ncbi:MAG TPA: GTPase ObgE [Candidatus Acetothermia bacterium]|nr:GTPase ObgE [Candidatus Acetothermia bacterium]
MWIDEARIHVAGGRGGDGLISFHRTKYNPLGTPDGGHGGDGGDVILEATRSMNTLLHFNHQVHFRAEDGGPGGPNKRQGKRGKDLIIHVPVGTVVRDLRTGEVIADLSAQGMRVVVARGGKGGRGNSAFVSNRWKGPKIRELGEPGEERWLKLELRLLADVGIVGFPNVGKSSFLSRVSRKKVKVAPYPFTTLEPHLGVVEVDGKSFVLADLPGLVEGAHEGKGLGDRFLRHATRARVLLHMVDLAGVEGRDPLEDYRAIRRELEAWEELKEKPEVVAGNKIDLLQPEEIARRISRFREAGVELYPISVVTGEGISELLRTLSRKLDEAPRESPSVPVQRTWKLVPRKGFRVARDDGVWVVEGREIERLGRLDLSTEDARVYLEEELERKGVFRALRRAGWKGEPIRIGGLEVEFELEG